MLNIPKHKQIMNSILLDIYRDKTLAPFLAFKGGTACMYFYGLPRFSTDLDFDLLDADKLKFVQQKILAIAEKYGKIKEEYLRDNTIFFLISYGESDMNLKIEISRRNYPNEYEVVNWKGYSLQIMKKPFVFAHKMVALTDRRYFAGRDVFDVYYFLSEGWEWSSDIIQLRTGLSDEQYIEQMIAYLESKKSENLLAHLGEVLTDTKQKYFVKHKLLDELIIKLKSYI